MSSGLSKRAVLPLSVTLPTTIQGISLKQHRRVQSPLVYNTMKALDERIQSRSELKQRLGPLLGFEVDRHNYGAHGS